MLGCVRANKCAIKFYPSNDYLVLNTSIITILILLTDSRYRESIYIYTTNISCTRLIKKNIFRSKNNRHCLELWSTKIFMSHFKSWIFIRFLINLVNLRHFSYIFYVDLTLAICIHWKCFLVLTSSDLFEHKMFSFLNSRIFLTNTFCGLWQSLISLGTCKIVFWNSRFIRGVGKCKLFKTMNESYQHL